MTASSYLVGGLVFCSPACAERDFGMPVLGTVVDPEPGERCTGCDCHLLDAEAFDPASREV